MSSGFWQGGPGAYLEGLHQDYHAHLTSLRERLEHSTDEAEREKIRIEIQVTQSKFEQKAAKIRKLIF
ncbi:MAG: hypothetical protein GTO26_09930 [Planctomycetales bacterium]|nr:hypothetical protein [Planctomycetales bacterium]NIO47046.1 hypothetical protein [Planctomycetales bacterium]